MQLSLIIWSPVLLPLFLLISTLRNPTEIGNTGQSGKMQNKGPEKIDMHELKLVRKRQEMPKNLILVHHRLDHLPWCTKASHWPWNGKLNTFRRDVPPGRATSKGKVGTQGALKPWNGQLVAKTHSTYYKQTSVCPTREEKNHPDMFYLRRK